MPRLSFSFFHVCETLKSKAKNGCCTVHRKEAQLGFELMYGLASKDYSGPQDRLYNMKLGHKGRLN